MALTISRALRLDRAARAALVGAGGKTSALQLLARELSPALAANSAHLGAWQADFADRHIVWQAGAPLSPEESRPASGITLITGPAHDDQRLGSLSLTQLNQVRALADAHGLPLLIEADGARGLPLKAPTDDEPPIPEFANAVIAIAGLTGIGQPLDGQHVHRPERFAALSGLGLGAPVTVEAVAQVMTNPKGSLKNIPAGARRAALLNQADTPELQALGARLAGLLLGAYKAVVVASLQSGAVFACHQRVAGIVLAAGAASRFGRPKQLLAYRGQPFVHAAASTALAAGLDPVVVVTGAHADGVAAALAGLPVQPVYNPGWEQGQSASIRAGLEALPAETGAAVFLLADQPQASVSVLRALVETHARGMPSVLAPMVEGRRANPVLFDRETFAALRGLRGDTGGRGIFDRFTPQYLPWHDPALLLDVDTEDDYRRLLEAGS